MTLNHDLALEVPAKAVRRAILLLEAAALLHDYGKLSQGFLAQAAADKDHAPPYEYQARVKGAFTRLDATQLTGKDKKKARSVVQSVQAAETPPTGTPWKDLQDAGVDVTALLREHTLRSWGAEDYDLAEVVALAGQWSGNVDWVPLLGKRMEPAKLIGRLHGAAHYEKQGVHEVNNPPLAQVSRATAFGLETLVADESLTEVLTGLPFTKLGKIATDARRQLLAELQQGLSQGPADTRRAVNDVTLWDWGYVVAGLTKAAAYTLFQSGWPADANLTRLSYRTIAIRVDRLGFYNRSDRITDMLGLRQTLDEAFRNVRTLLEEQYALGNRQYHDETGEYYLGPNLDAEAQATLREQIVGLFPDDLAPAVLFSTAVAIDELDNTNNDLAERLAIKQAAVRKLLVEPLRPTTAVLSPSALDGLAATWTSAQRPANAEICSVCRVRPVGGPRATTPAGEREAAQAKERKICRVCLARRARRSRTWLDNTDDQPTIWTDEVADYNGRLALFVGAFGLDQWLDGTHLRTLIADKTLSPNDPAASKMASPARLYRITETARAFWEEVSTTVTPQVAGQRPCRLAIKPAQVPDLAHGMAYKLRLNGQDLAVVWDDQAKHFLSTENLGYFSKLRGQPETELGETLQNTLLRLLEPSGFLQAGVERGLLGTVTVTEAAGYTPFIPLLAEPSLCMLLVPADKALALCRKVREKYEQEMARVADRLPLTLGLVYFGRHTPLAAVLDAGTRLLSRRPQRGEWIVQSRSGMRVAFEENGSSLSHTYPATLAGPPGSESHDDWYPYVTLVPADADDEAEVRHVRELVEGDRVYLWPGTFDFEYLDTAGRRYEIAYDAQNGWRLSRDTRPFLLSDLSRLDRIWGRVAHLSLNQQYQVLHTIEATREAWQVGAAPDPVFASFVADTLGGANWGRENPWKSWDEEAQQETIAAGVSGELADLAELYLHILKASAEEEIAA